MTRTKIKALRPTYATIDLEAFGHNIEVARKISGADIIAVVKADGYGHGATPLAEYAYKKKAVKRFGVATIKEGISLRQALGNEPRIYVLGYVDKKFYEEVTENNLTLTVFDDVFADSYHNYLISNELTADVSVKIDTGMSRLGFDTEMSFNKFISDYERFNVVHLMSHLSSSDSDVQFTEDQIVEFDKFLKKNDINTETSLFNSSGICCYNNKYDLVRPGIMLYGYVYGNEEIELKKVMKIYSKIAHVKNVKKGDSISYNRKFIAEKDMVIGVVPIGYADGYRRSFTNRSHMMVNGCKCPVVGTVCMDMTMVDLTGVNIENDMTVEILSDDIDATYWADMADTINYEILCGISDRIPRIYLD